MKTLDKHNLERQEEHQLIIQSQQPHPNGIECPDCGKELWDSNPTVTLTSNPCKKNINCPECGYIGYRLA